jgi:S1-C subfamily serine protease
MLRALFVALLCAAGSPTAAGQALGVLHIKVAVVDTDRKVTPVPRHVLLISDNPSTAPPRQIVTRIDGTAEVRLRPGNYTVESDQPVAFRGRAYQWTQMVDIVAGRDAVLELTADNADAAPATSAPASSASPSESDAAFLLPQWQDSVVAVWTPDNRASGFVVDARGLVATNQRAVGSSTAVEVQLTPDVKVAARVLAADAARDVAVLWIDPAVAASVRPVPLGCGQPVTPAIAEGQTLFTIGAPLREQKGMTSGTVSRVEDRSIASDLRVARGSAGGPVFTAGGGMAGLTSVVDDEEENRRGAARIVRIAAACEVVAAAEKKMNDAAPPDGTRLPVEPARPFPVNALKEAVQRRAGSLNPYQVSSSDFDIAFITPVLVYGAQHQSEQARERGRPPLMDFGRWSDYMADFPPVLAIRVTPRQVEGFWTRVARGAAVTQGVALPPMKRPKSDFSRMRAYCGDVEVTPIHPFTLEQRVSETMAIGEGFYIFDPGALGPQCGAVKLVLYSEKEPEKGDIRVVDPGVLQQIWRDYEPYRSAP